MSELQERIEATAQVFRQWVLDQGYRATPDGRVVEAVAADLLGRAPKTLSNLRSLGMGPVYFRAGGRVEYRIHDLAEWVETSREITYP